jgi:D-alanyl-D-alanine carboxypeptidase (penicillin-binding protein 5/6)
MLGIDVRPSNEAVAPVTDEHSLFVPCVMAAAALLGIVYTLAVKPGVSYDEPSHWLNTLYFAHHHRIPTIGDPTVTYEAQQPPLAYAVAGLVEGFVHAVVSLKAAFYATRIVGGLEWLVALLCAWRLLVRLLPHHETECRVAFAVLALNPMLLAMAWSVQNDSLALLLGFAALDYATTVGREHMSARQGAVLGLIVAAGVLTKLTDWALVAAIPAWLLLAPTSRRAWGAVVAFAGSVGVLSGWWFVRNVVMYGDPLGRGRAAAESGGFLPYPLTGLHSIVHAGENVVTYLWLPTEYWRGLIHAPAVVKGSVLGLSVTTLVLGSTALVRRFQRRPGHGPARAPTDSWSGTWSLVVITGVIAFTVWLVLYFGWSALAPRLAYLALPLWMGLVGLAAGTMVRGIPRIRPVLPSATIVTMVALTAWCLVAIRGTSIPWGFIGHL